jgi:glycosyltransferase involved in cell wall biosynthesis
LTPPRGAQRIFNRALGRRARHITAVSRDLQHRLATEEGFARQDIALVPNAVDSARFARPLPEARDTARHRLGVPPHAPILGSVGRLEPVKNHVALVYVIAHLRRRLPDALLVIAGEGPQRRPLEVLARQLGVADAVRLVGARRDVEELLPAFDVFALPSLCEGIPLALLEAMAAGIPVVAAATGGIPEAARAEQDALLVDGEPIGESYVERFTAAVERLLIDPACGRRLTESARLRVHSEFDIETVCRRYREILAEAAGG